MVASYSFVSDKILLIYSFVPYKFFHSIWFIKSYAEIADQVMREYGYSIEHILMVDIIPDASVRKAMNEINAGNLSFFLFW